MNIVISKTLMHMHVQSKCFNIIYCWILIYDGKKKTLESSLQTSTREL
jgi:hypothetical protein